MAYKGVLGNAPFTEEWGSGGSGGSADPLLVVYRGVCPDSGSDRAVSVDEGFELSEGAMVAVLFENKLDGNVMNLSVNGTDSSPVVLSSSAGTLPYSLVRDGMLFVLRYTSGKWVATAPLAAGGSTRGTVVLSTNIVGDMNDMSKAVTPKAVVEYVSGKIGSVYRYKGQVDTYDDLLALEADPQVALELGDVYNVKETDINYAWAEPHGPSEDREWDPLGPSLSGYVKHAEIIENGHVKDGMVVSESISEGAVTSDKIAGGSVTSDKIADGVLDVFALKTDVELHDACMEGDEDGDELGEWVVSAPPGSPPVVEILWAGRYWLVRLDAGDGAQYSATAAGTLDSTSIEWDVAGYHYTATREVLPPCSGYRLGPDSDDNPNRERILAAQADLESLADRVKVLEQGGGDGYLRIDDVLVLDNGTYRIKNNLVKGASIANNVITTGKISDGAITRADLNQALSSDLVLNDAGTGYRLGRDDEANPNRDSLVAKADHTHSAADVTGLDDVFVKKADVGNIFDGESDNPQSGKAILEAMEEAFNYKAITVTSFTATNGGTSTFVYGTAVSSLKFDWTLSKTAALLTIKGQSGNVSGNPAQTSRPTSATGSWTYSMSPSLTEPGTYTFRITAREPKALAHTVAPDATRDCNVLIQNYVVYGTGPEMDKDVLEGVLKAGSNTVGKFTRALSGSRSRTFTVNAVPGEYIWYCYPKRLGEAHFAIGIVDGGFMPKVEIESAVNAKGGAENYYVYHSQYAGIGSQTVAVS